MAIGNHVPSGSAEAFPARARALVLPGSLLSLIAPFLAVMRHLNRQLAYSDETIERVAAHDERVQRFHHAHQLEAYLGLVPRECSSGDTQRRGPITKAGSSRPPEAEALQTWALRIGARRGNHVAVVALARRLAGILYALLHDGTVFTPRRTPQPVATLESPPAPASQPSPFMSE